MNTSRLDLSDPTLKESLARVRSDVDPATWIVLGYEGKSKIICKEVGEGRCYDALDIMEDSEVRVAARSCSTPNAPLIYASPNSRRSRASSAGDLCPAPRDWHPRPRVEDGQVRLPDVRGIVGGRHAARSRGRPQARHSGDDRPEPRPVPDRRQGRHYRYAPRGLKPQPRLRTCVCLNEQRWRVPVRTEEKITGMLKKASGANYDLGSNAGGNYKGEGSASIQASARNKYKALEKETNIAPVVFDKYDKPKDVRGCPFCVPPAFARARHGHHGRPLLQ